MGRVVNARFPFALPLGKRPGTQCTGGWLGPRVCVDGCGKSRKPLGFELRPSSQWWAAIPAMLSRPTVRCVCVFRCSTALVDQGRLIIEAIRSQSDTPHSVGLFRTSDQPVAETSTWQHTTLTIDRHPCTRRDSNPQFKRASSRRPTP